MKSLVRGIAALVTITAFGLVSGAMAADIGKVTRIRGEATAGSGGRSHPLALASGVAIGERLVTGPDARLEVTLTDGTVFTLGENAVFTIDELSIKGNRGTALFSRIAGALRLIAGAVAKQPQHRIEITGAVATIGIRGTDVWGGSVRSLYDVFLFDGSVEVRTRRGRVVLTEPGTGTSITAPGARPQRPDRWPPELQARAFATVSFDAP